MVTQNIYYLRGQKGIKKAILQVASETTKITWRFTYTSLPEYKKLFPSSENQLGAVARFTRLRQCTSSKDDRKFSEVDVPNHTLKCYHPWPCTLTYFVILQCQANYETNVLLILIIHLQYYYRLQTETPIATDYD